jgi:hypothetical protein
MPNQISAYVKNAENSTTKWHKHAEPPGENFDHGQKSHAERIHPHADNSPALQTNRGHAETPT